MDLSETFRRVAEAMGESARAPGYLATAPELRRFLDANLAAAPPAAGLSEELFSLEAQQYLADAALDLAADGWRRSDAGGAAVPDDLGRDAVYEVLAATAACAAHEETGRLAVDRPFCVEAVRRVSALGQACGGLGPLVRAYAAVAAFDDLQAVDFYQPLAEDTFVAGAWHRPWVSHPLTGELLMAAAAGLLRVRREQGGPRVLFLTPQGRHVLEALRERLEDAGVLAARRSLLALAHRNAIARHGLAARSGTEAGEDWIALLAAAGIAAGSRVLLCGLAAGGRELTRQVADVVGAGGAVYVVDPAVAVLRRFAARGPAVGRDGAERAGREADLPAHVRLLPGRFSALPLSDGAVDACLAPAFLHLAEHDRVLGEIRRVVRPGGRVALAVPHAVDTRHALLREWLEPLLDLAAQLEVAESGHLHAPGQAGEALARHGFVGVEVRPHALPLGAHAHGALWHMVHGAEMGRGVLDRAPWRERRDLLQALAERGERLWAASERAAEALRTPGELVLARVP